MSFPDNCPKCGRRTVDFLIYPEDDPMVEILLRRTEESNHIVREHEKVREQEELPNVAYCNIPLKRSYILKSLDGYEIAIPEEGGIIGRSCIGAEYLGDYPSVSREHLRVTPRRNLGVIIEDLSSFGTLLDGKRIEKNMPVRATVNSRIILCNVEFVLLERGI